MGADEEFTPRASDEAVSARALAELSRLLKTPIEAALDLAAVARKGVAPEMAAVLVDSGFARREIEWIVPPRTLSHRRRTVDHSPPTRLAASCAP